MSEQEENNQLVIRPSKIFLWFVLGFIILALANGYQKGVVQYDAEYILSTGLFALLLFGVPYWFLANMYVKVTDNMKLTVSFHNSLSKRTTRIPEIKYIMRMPMYAVPMFGTMMMIYVEDEGRLKHITITEGTLNDWKLRDLLEKLMRINPNIVLDDEYKNFLAQPRDDERKNIFVGESTKNKVKDVEQFLREHGEVIG